MTTSLALPRPAWLRPPHFFHPSFLATTVYRRGHPTAGPSHRTWAQAPLCTLPSRPSLHLTSPAPSKTGSVCPACLDSHPANPTHESQSTSRSRISPTPSLPPLSIVPHPHNHSAPQEARHSSLRPRPPSPLRRDSGAGHRARTDHGRLSFSTRNSSIRTVVRRTRYTAPSVRCARRTWPVEPSTWSQP